MAPALNILIVGPGAMGLFYGAKLASVGHRVGFVGRAPVPPLDRDGILLREFSEGFAEGMRERRIRPAWVANLGDRPPINFAPDGLLVTAKTTANPLIAKDLPRLVASRDTIVGTLQNGLGNIEWLREIFPENPVVAGLCSVCINRLAPDTVENYFSGKIEWGSFADRYPEATARLDGAFRDAGLPSSRAASLADALWRKLVWNIPFNGLSVAAGGLTTDRLLADPALAGRVRAVMREVQTLAAALGAEVSDPFVKKLLEATRRMKAYRPSTLIDFEAGRPLEVEAIWLRPLAAAQELGVEVPGIQAIAAKLQEINAKRS